MPRRQKLSRRGKNRSAWVYARGSHLKTPKATKTRDGKQWTGIIALGVGAGLLLGRVPASWAQAHRVGAAAHVPVVFSGGHGTDPEDRGRPVALVAGGLGVPAKVFRDAFRLVHPAPDGTAAGPRTGARGTRTPCWRPSAPTASPTKTWIGSRITTATSAVGANTGRPRRRRPMPWSNGGGSLGTSSRAAAPATAPRPPTPCRACPERRPEVRLVWSKTLEQNGSVAAITTPRR